MEVARERESIAKLNRWGKILDYAFDTDTDADDNWIVDLRDTNCADLYLPLLRYLSFYQQNASKQVIFTKSICALMGQVALYGSLN